MADTPPDTPSPNVTVTPRSLISLALTQGDLKIHPIGLERKLSLDFYHRLMQASWPTLGLLFVGIFLGFNLIFAALFSLDPAGLATAHDPTRVPEFWRLFFFSVHTVATIGYGNTYPVSAYANVMVVVEITMGIVYFALTTGIAFARFSRPTARMLFSQTLIVREIEGVPTLMLRAANQRHNVIYSAQAQLSLLADGEVGGVRMRRIIDLGLVRSSNPAFALTWTIMHPIAEGSPLRAWHDAGGEETDHEVIIILSGTDEASGQTIHGRWAYRLRDARRNARFADIIGSRPDGSRTIDYRHFHDVIPVE